MEGGAGRRGDLRREAAAAAAAVGGGGALMEGGFVVPPRFCVVALVGVEPSAAASESFMATEVEELIKSRELRSF